MKVLGVDTAASIASAAIVEDGKLLYEETHPTTHPAGDDGRPNHAETLLPLIDRLLKKARLGMADISALAVSIGPGSFTGLRIGLSSVKGLAYGWEIPVLGVPTLTAVAMRVTDWDGLICSLLDARKKEVYAALFRRQDGAIERLTDDLAAAPERVLEHIQTLDSRGSCLFIGEGTKIYGDLIRSAMGNKASLTLGESYPSTAFAVACLGEKRATKGDYDAPGPLVPSYLRPAEAEIKLKTIF